MPDASDSSESPSLPSISLHAGHMKVCQTSPSKLNITNESVVQNMVPMVNGSQMMTMREYDTKLNELRKENFNLKLRIYFMDKERTGVSKPGNDDIVIISFY